MPTNRVKNKAEAEKKPTGQELLETLLDPIQHSAVKTIQKVQKEQITQAMQNGVPAEHILQQLGINPKLPVNQEIVDDPGKALGKINPSKVEDSNINSMTVPGGYTTKPASSPFGFGGASMQNGQVVEQQPGFAAGLLMALLSGNPKTSAKMDLQRMGMGVQINRQQQLAQNQGFYQFNPMTGELEEIAKLPKGSQVRNLQVSPQERAEAYGKVSVDVAKQKEELKRESPERVQMSASLEQMDLLLNDMETYIQKDPMAFVKGLNPLAEREFKAIVQNFDKTAAIAAGGKQLTKTELDLIRNTRPTILDTKNPKAIQYKFNILKNTIALARERLNKGTKSEQKIDENLVSKYMKKYPNRSREEIIKAMQRTK